MAEEKIGSIASEGAKAAFSLAMSKGSWSEYSARIPEVELSGVDFQAMSAFTKEIVKTHPTLVENLDGSYDRAISYLIVFGGSGADEKSLQVERQMSGGDHFTEQDCTMLSQSSGARVISSLFSRLLIQYNYISTAGRTYSEKLSKAEGIVTVFLATFLFRLALAVGSGVISSASLENVFAQLEWLIGSLRTRLTSSASSRSGGIAGFTDILIDILAKIRELREAELSASHTKGMADILSQIKASLYYLEKRVDDVFCRFCFSTEETGWFGQSPAAKSFVSIAGYMGASDTMSLIQADSPIYTTIKQLPKEILPHYTSALQLAKMFDDKVMAVTGKIPFSKESTPMIVQVMIQVQQWAKKVRQDIGNLDANRKEEIFARFTISGRPLTQEGKLPSGEDVSEIWILCGEMAFASRVGQEVCKRSKAVISLIGEISAAGGQNLISEQINEAVENIKKLLGSPSVSTSRFYSLLEFFSTVNIHRDSSFSESYKRLAIHGLQRDAREITEVVTRLRILMHSLEHRRNLVENEGVSMLEAEVEGLFYASDALAFILDKGKVLGATYSAKLDSAEVLKVNARKLGNSIQEASTAFELKSDRLGHNLALNRGNDPAMLVDEIYFIDECKYQDNSNPTAQEMFSACSSGFVQNKSILVVDPLGHFAYHKDMAESKDDLRVILDAKSSSLATRIAMESYSKMNIPTIKREEIVPIYTVGIEESKQPSSPVPSSASPVPSSASSVPGRATIYPAALPGPLNRKVFSQESLSGSVSRSQSFSLSPYSLSSPSPVRAAAPAIGFDRPVQQKKLQVVVSYLGVDYPAVDVDLCASSRQFKDKKRSLLESQISAAVLFRSAALQSSPPAAASSSSSAVAVVSSPSQKLFGYFNEEEKCLKIFDPIRRVEIEKELDDVLLTGQIKSIVQSAKDNLVSFVSSGLDIKVKIYGEEYDAVSVDRNFIIPDVLSGRGAIIFFGEKNGDGADIYIYNPKKIHTIHVSDSVLSMCGITEIASASREDNRLAFAGVVGVADSPDTPVHSRTFA